MQYNFKKKKSLVLCHKPAWILDEMYAFVSYSDWMIVRHFVIGCLQGCISLDDHPAFRLDDSQDDRKARKPKLHSQLYVYFSRGPRCTSIFGGSRPQHAEIVLGCGLSVICVWRVLSMQKVSSNCKTYFERLIINNFKFPRSC